MPDKTDPAWEFRSKQRGKDARRAVSRQLAAYHQSLLAAFSEDSVSFFDRIMEQAGRDIQSRHELQRTQSQPPKIAP